MVVMEEEKICAAGVSHTRVHRLGLRFESSFKSTKTSTTCYSSSSPLNRCQFITFRRHKKKDKGDTARKTLEE